MVNTQLLDWDSEMLGVRVAKILDSLLDEKQLAQCLLDLKSKKIKCVYWTFDHHKRVSQQAANACGGLRVDEKITYCLDLSTLSPLPFPYPEVEIYTDSYANAELIDLALEISPFSRFSHDPNIPAERVVQLYTTWINNACKKIVAKIVLVIKIQNHIKGMVTIDDKQNRGDLSLLAVNPQHQSQGLGKRLVCAAQSWCITQGYSISQVVTQKKNPNACRLYERCAYKHEKTEFFYHFWL